MLTSLSIRNVVLIEALDLSFASGLGVLTGETGAGKSILLDALGLVLGDRADSGLVRAGEDQASVTATFEFDRMPAAIRAEPSDEPSSTHTTCVNSRRRSVMTSAITLASL